MEMNKNLLLNNRNFRLICLTTLISSIGDGMYNLACTLTLYAMSGSVAGVAGMWLIRALIRIPSQFIAGVISDKYNRKHISVGIYIISAILVLLFIVTSNEYIIFAYSLIFILQGTSDVDHTAQMAMLPEIVKKEELASANSIFSLLGTIISLVAPGLGGILYKVYGGNILYIADSITFIISAILMAMISYKFKKVHSTKEQKFMLFSYAREGYTCIREKSVLKIILFVMMGCSVLGRFYEIYKIHIINQIIGMNAEDIVYLSYAMAIGSIVAPLIVSNLKNKINNITVFLYVCILLLLSYTLWGNSKGFIMCFVANIFIGIFSCIMTITFNTLYQSEIENKYLGRAMAFYKICTVLSAIVGIVIAPKLLDIIGVGVTITIASTLIAFFVIYLALKKQK